ncbi:hypothetical protein N4T77_18440 [Clostridium sp. CX1]|uniref:CD3072 family TudS-related putative desulfidase n=1 Tax=Clostridium sp. CX1 TaxID=2978346 RepID=UPI0021BEC152|nr:CD3072 family TudS-related putative desulfidase [Clostridium sp. CX1]MCT8978572.1 hypothetical protein [Clostridium sp. CX1]
MKRTKKIVIVSHCILNVNSKVEGCCEFGQVSSNFIKYLIDNDYGIIQMPCPETTIYGIKRWGHVKEQFDTPYYRKHCRGIFEPILEQIEDYINNGYKIKALIGINGSPSCGHSLTCSSNSWGGEFASSADTDEKISNLKCITSPGIFIEEIEKMLKDRGIEIELAAVDEENEELTMNNIRKILEA